MPTDRLAWNCHADGVRPDQHSVERGAEQGARLQLSRSEEYRSCAAECMECAKEARDSELKHQFEKVAQHWLQLAAQMDRLGW
jgi:hypothetical protein